MTAFKIKFSYIADIEVFNDCLQALPDLQEFDAIVFETTESMFKPMKRKDWISLLAALRFIGDVYFTPKCPDYMKQTLKDNLFFDGKVLVKNHQNIIEKSS